MPSYFTTLTTLVYLKTDKAKEIRAIYKDMPFSFSSKDMSAIREVLVDQEYQFLKDYISDIAEPSILDIGANIGTFALWCLGENKHSKVLSIEAGVNTFSTLERNTELATNQQAISWTALHRAAWKNNEDLSFSDSHESMAGKISQQGEQKVQGISLRDLIQVQLEKTGKEYIDVLKIDIEGSEEHFLNNSEENQAALDKVKRLVIELHPDYCDVTGVEELIKKTFSTIENCTDRISTKPLLDCYN